MNEKELIVRSQKGDEGAFKELFDLYKGKIFNLCIGIVKDEGIANDLTQETFVNAYQHLDTFRQEASFYTWSYHIARNLSLNYIKKKGQVFEEPLQEEKFSSSPIADKEIQEMIKEGLATLNPKHRLIFECYELQKMSHKEIAALLDISVGTSRSRLHYARKKMRTFLKAKYKNHPF